MKQDKDNFGLGMWERWTERNDLNGDLLEFARPHCGGDGEEDECLGDHVGVDHDDDDM